MTTAIPATQAEKDQLLVEGARLLYTVAAGQFFELGDINAWFERYNAIGGEPFASDHYGAIGERSNELDPLLNQAVTLLAQIADGAQAARTDFETSVTNARQGGGS